MITFLYPQQTSTLYEMSSSLNTGRDEILEIKKDIFNGTGSKYVSRVLLQFDITSLSQSISNGIIKKNAKFYLNVNAVDTRSIPVNYTLYCHAISSSWDMGTGNLLADPNPEDGVSWSYRKVGVSWATSSFASGVTGSYQTTKGGGTWYSQSQYTATQSFSNQLTDIRMDVTNIVKKWISGSVKNNGFILKHSNTDEKSNTIMGDLLYFSTNTHTIYPPQLQASWDDSTFTTGSLTALTDENIIVYSKNIKEQYKDGSHIKMRVLGRSQYPTRTFTTASNYATYQYLPTSSTYSIMDTVTEEVLIPFDNLYTKISCDSNGNYFNLWMDNFQQERYYKVRIRTYRNGNVEYHEPGIVFKVVR